MAVDLSQSASQIQKIDMLRQHLWDIAGVLQHLSKAKTSRDQGFETQSLMTLVRLVAVQQNLLGEVATGLTSAHQREGDVDLF